MIVVVSDLHLTDGASGRGVEPGAFTVFARLLGDMARHASHRVAGFRPPEALDVVLLGDILDLLRSGAWPPRRGPDEHVPRPWEPPAMVAPVAGQVVDRILEANQEGLAVLRAFARDGALFYEDGQVFRIPVRITYLVGNHDWLLRLPGPAYDAVRERVVASLGLANDPARPFPHDLAEVDPAFAERVRRHRLVLRHGDIYDPFNYAGDRNRSALGDAVVIELLNRFPEAVREELGLAPDDPLFLELREIDNVRPFSTIPAWVLGVIRRFGLEATAGGAAVLGTWSRLGEEFFALDFVRSRDRAWSWDEVDRLQLGFRFLRRYVSGRVARTAVSQLLKLLGDPRAKYVYHALAEPEVASGAARFVAYGHTHVHEIRPLDVREEPAAERQFYFNCGTWRPTYRQTVADPEQLDFVGYHAMTAVAFYAEGERAGRGFEVWNGALEASG